MVSFTGSNDNMREKWVRCVYCCNMLDYLDKKVKIKKWVGYWIIKSYDVRILFIAFMGV